MRLIPVVDLQGDVVVHAIGGQRNRYSPLLSPLSASATLKDVAQGLLSNFPSRDLYVADLDAINGVGNHRKTLVEFCNAQPQLCVWLDAGTKNVSDVGQIFSLQNVRVVVGTETLRDMATLAALVDKYADLVVLSLDWKGSEFLGPPEVLQRPDCWPSRVIVMTLDSVGRDQGPDLERLRDVVAAAGDRQVFAAGGVRSVAGFESVAQGRCVRCPRCNGPSPGPNKIRRPR